MNLEERYNLAPESSYVGKVRTRQASDAGAGPGVNFMDGTPRITPGPDVVQTEFTRNNSNDFKYGGGGKIPGTYSLSRWLPRGRDFGDTYFVNTRYTTTSDVRNAPGRIVHKFSPLAGKKFDESNILSAISKGKISGSPNGPSPAGLNG